MNRNFYLYRSYFLSNLLNSQTFIDKMNNFFIRDLQLYFKGFLSKFHSGLYDDFRNKVIT